MRPLQDIMSASEWEREWAAMDKEQLAEFLKSSELCVPSESTSFVFCC